MSRRLYIARFECGHEGCRETAHYECQTRSEQTDLYRKYASSKWLCSRHSNPETVLSPTNLKTVNEVQSKTHHYDGKSIGVYWENSGLFSFGPGFRAWAEDFPEGTVLRVTAEIVLP